jgi:hypothetical protein
VAVRLQRTVSLGLGVVNSAIGEPVEVSDRFWHYLAVPPDNAVRQANGVTLNVLVSAADRGKITQK